MLVTGTEMPLSSYLFIGFIVVFFPVLGWALYRHMMSKAWVREGRDT
ncbi:hypothetical protein [Natrononativus amylolyticus]|nr:hypothetical protein [Natrononativus amylolyticus]